MTRKTSPVKEFFEIRGGVAWLDVQSSGGTQAWKWLVRVYIEDDDYSCQSVAGSCATQSDAWKAARHTVSVFDALLLTR